MKKKKRLILRVERERLLVVSHARAKASEWCSGCDAEVVMVSVAEAAALAGLSQRTIFRLVEYGRVHFAETEGGSLYICVNSLTQTAAGRQLQVKAKTAN